MHTWNTPFLFLGVISLGTLGLFSPVNRYRIMEESRSGTIVANLTRDLMLDKESRRYLRITNWKDSGPRHFEINNTTGLLIVKTPPDRELLCDQTPICTILLSIAYGNRYDPTIVTISIELEDKNDHAPSFPRRDIQLEILENTKPHQNVLDLPSARDPDFEENGTIIYSLKNTKNAPFKLESRPGDPPRLLLITPLNWEKVNNYVMLVLAKDGGSPAKTGTLTVHISVKDDNDHAPVFTKVSYDVTIKENVAKNVKILELRALDRDSGANGAVQYSIAQPTTNLEIEASRFFGIKTIGKVGHLYVREKLDIDRRESRQFKLTVEATDNGIPRKSSKVKVVIRVEDINDYTPTISISYMNEDHLDKNMGYIQENIKRSFIGQVSVEDYDGGSGGEVQCHTTDDRFQLEEMSRNPSGHRREFKLMSQAFFDREVTSRVTFSIVCVDNINRINDDIQLTGRANIMVIIQDENDEAPVFPKKLYTFYVKENVPRPGSRGIQIGRVTAIDKDLGLNAKISYELLNKPLNDFKIDQTGIIYLLRPFDRETTPDVNLTIKASDGKFSTTTQVRIVILDVNDSPPVFLRSDYRFDVPENVRNASVGTVQAKDYDQDKNISYFIEYSKNIFSVNSRTGHIWVNRPLDREDEERYVFHVLAVDNPSSGLSQTRNTGTATVTVKVDDANDNSPVINYPTTHSSISVEEGAPAGHNLFTISATDRDYGENGSVQYRILKGDNSIFGIDSASGIVFLTSKLIDSTTGYLLVLIAEDRGTPYSRNATVALKVSVQPKSNLADQGNYPGELSSSLANRTIIIILSTIFIILLVTTLILGFLIKRRRDTERHKFRGKCQYGKNLAAQELSIKSTGADKPPEEGKMIVPRGGEYQGIYSPLRSTFSPLLVNQQRNRMGEVISGSTESGNKGGAVFWCKAPSTVKLPDCTNLPGPASAEMMGGGPHHPKRTFSSDYQTLDTNFIGGGVSVGTKADMANLYYEINTGRPGRTAAPFQLHTSADGLPYHSLYRMGTMDHHHNPKRGGGYSSQGEDGAPLRGGGGLIEDTGDQGSMDEGGLDSGGSTSGGDNNNPWSSSVTDMKTLSRSGGQLSTTSRGRGKPPVGFSPYAEASFV